MVAASPFLSWYNSAMRNLRPSYSDRHRRSFAEFITVALVVSVIVLGLVRGVNWSIFLGVLVALFVWFTTPFKYYVFDDRLVVTYGLPRRLVVSFGEMSEFGLAKMPMGYRLVIRRRRGRTLLLNPVDPQAFHDRLAEAVSGYRARNPQQAEDA